MKIAAIISLALLGLAATVCPDPAAAKPGNGHGYQPNFGAVETEIVAGRGRGRSQRSTAETTVDAETGVLGQGNRPVSGSEPGRGRGNRPRPDTAIQGEETPEVFSTEFGDVFPTERGRRSGSLPPGLQRQIERGDGLPPGLQRQIERGRGLPPGLQR